MMKNNCQEILKHEKQITNPISIEWKQKKKISQQPAKAKDKWFNINFDIGFGLFIKSLIFIVWNMQKPCYVRVFSNLYSAFTNLANPNPEHYFYWTTSQQKLYFELIRYRTVLTFDHFGNSYGFTEIYKHVWQLQQFWNFSNFNPSWWFKLNRIPGEFRICDCLISISLVFSSLSSLIANTKI